MNEAELRRRMDGVRIEICVLREAVSTHTAAMEIARKGTDIPVLITADRQTGGRGRTGKPFLSPEGGLYFSLILPGEMPLRDAVGATSCAAAAMRRAILCTTGADCGIKWVNDLYLGGGKLCGILCESVNDYGTMTSLARVIGAGVNLKTAPVLTDSDIRAVSLAEAGFHAEPEPLCAAAIKELLAMQENGFSFADCAEEYRHASLVLGREITYEKNGVSRTGTAVGVDDRGGLIVRTAAGTEILSGGEIHVRPVPQPEKDERN